MDSAGSICSSDACGDDAFCATYQDSPLAWESPGIGRAVLFLILQTGCYFAVIFFLESGLAKNIRQKILAQAVGPMMMQNQVRPW